MNTSNTATPFRPKLWVPGDWNAFFGFGTNILVNVLTMTGLLRFVIGMPDELVFGRILPAVGLMLVMSTFYYAWMAHRLAIQTGREDVCALPSGPGVGHMFICVFVVMLPIKLATNDPIKAWEAGLTWVFIQSIVLILGGFVGQWVRKVTPRAALLGTLAGVSITFISMRPALQMFMTPTIGLLCFAILMISWFGGLKYFRGLPAGCIALAVGTLIAWGSNLFDLNFGGLSLQALAASFTNFGFRIPSPAIDHTFAGFEYLGILLVTAIPFGLYDLIEAIDNVESAAVAGDSFPTRRVLMADGVCSMVGCLMGNPFVLAVYIGHPGWKAMGGRRGYSFATGLMVIGLCWFGLASVMLAAIPLVAILPILLYIGMLIGSQAFQETPRKHAPAIILAIIPHIAHWAAGMIRSTLTAAGAGDFTPELSQRLAAEGVMLEGLEILGGGAVLSGIVLSATMIFIIERQFWRAAAFASAGAAFTFFGFMHGEHIGFAQSPTLAIAYLMVAAFLAACAKSTVEKREEPTGPTEKEQENAEAGLAISH